MNDKKICSRCQEPLYASYKNMYFCVKHLEEFLQEEKNNSLSPKISE